MKKITIKLRGSCGYGLFHDSRTDVNNLAETINVCIDKINEIVDTVNKMQEVKP